jgi:hypothetical protein
MRCLFSSRGCVVLALAALLPLLSACRKEKTGAVAAQASGAQTRASGCMAT